MNMINKESEYSLLIIDYLAKFPKDKIIGSKEISNNLNISLNITLKLLRTLVNQNIIKSFRGKDGGYTLIKKNISYYEIIEIIQGKIFKDDKKYNSSIVLENLLKINELYIKKLYDTKIF